MSDADFEYPELTKELVNYALLQTLKVRSEAAASYFYGSILEGWWETSMEKLNYRTPNECWETGDKKLRQAVVAIVLSYLAPVAYT